jgi:hypothetical protein
VTTDQFEPASYVELLQHAAAVDQMTASCPDQDLALELSTGRGRLDDALQTLAGRCGLIDPSPKELDHWRRFPWDRSV